ncbi:hypothetical protein, partial [Pseudomonas guineae]|uniref:hypothetical protein n=1 Tax=Pseudomonas guineae TaxID=425504 RepID=UPI0030EDAFD5
MTADNLDAVNAEIATSTAADADSTAEIQALADSGIATQQTADQQSALDTISAYAEDPVNNPAPTEQDFVDAGVTGVTADNLDAVNAEVASSTAADANSTAEIQTLADSGIAAQQPTDPQAALDTISAYAEDPVNN